MKNVSIQLDPGIAKAFAAASPEERKHASELVNRWLRNIFGRSDTSGESLFATMEQIGRLAEANGLTEQKLDELLNEKR
jgi:hypothetical protein